MRYSAATEAVKTGLRNSLSRLFDMNEESFEQVYDAALLSISRGRDLSVLFNTLIQMNINGITKDKAEEISRLINNKATAIIDRERQESLGLTQAHWLYFGAPCEVNPKKPTGQDAAHKAADGKLFEIGRGVFLNGKWTWPGMEPGCKCVSKSVTSGFS